MIRLCADTNKPMADGYVFYNLSENGMDTYPEKNSEITATVHIHSNWFCLR